MVARSVVVQECLMLLRIVVSSVFDVYRLVQNPVIGIQLAIQKFKA
jgi:hypothetical protein